MCIFILKESKCVVLFYFAAISWYLPSVQENQVQSLGQKNPLEKGMVAYSSILAGRIPWTEEPDCNESDMTERLTFSL